MATQEEIARLVISLEGEVTDLKNDLKQGGDSVKKFSKNSNSVLKTLRSNWLGVAAAVTAMVFVLRKNTKEWSSFKTRLAEVNTLVNLSARDMRKYEKQILQMSTTIPQSANELTAALYDIVSAGVAVKDSTKVLEQSSKAAVAGVTNTKTAAKVGLAVINAYSLEISELGNVYDKLFQTVKLGVLTFPQLAQSIGVVLPVARAANVGFDEVAASIAAMTKAGIDTPRAATAMRSGIAALSAPTKQAKDEMERLGIVWKGWVPTLKQIAEKGLTLDQMRKLIPDIRAGQAIISLSQNLDTLTETLDEVSTSAGSMEEAFKIMEQTPESQMKLLANSVGLLRNELLSTFTPAIMASVKSLIEMFRGARFMLGMSDVIASLPEQTVRIATMKPLENFLKNFKPGNTMEIGRDLGQVIGVEAGKTTFEELQKELESRKKLISDIVTGKKAAGESAAAAKKLAEEEALAKAQAVAAAAESVGKVSKEKAKEIEKIAARARTSILSESLEGQLQLLRERYDEELVLVENNLEAQENLRTELDQNVQAIFDAHQERLRKEQKAEIDSAGKIADAKIAAIRKAEEERIAVEEKKAEDALKEKQDLLEKIDLWAQAAQQITSTFSNMNQVRMNNIQAQADEERRRIEDSVGNEEWKANKLKQLDAETTEALRKQKEKQKKWAIMDTIINTAAGIIKMYNSGLDPVSATAFAVILAALGASKIALISSQKYEKGGRIGGELHSGGGTPIEAERDEYIMSRRATAKYGFGAMEAINKGLVPSQSFVPWANLMPNRPSGFFKDGGQVTSQVNRSARQDINIVNFIDSTAMDRYLSTVDGQRAILNVISSQSYNVSRILGVQT